jgi:hypothetical protein
MDIRRPDERLHAQITLAVDGIPVPPGPNQLRATRAHPARLPIVLAAAGLAAVFVVTALSFDALRAAREGPADVTPPPTAGSATPGNTPPPGLRRYPVRTPDEVLAGMATDPFVTLNAPTWDPKSLGMPIFVRALRASDDDVWLVPQLSEGKAYAVIVVSVGKDGLGGANLREGADNSSGGPAFPFPFPVPPFSEAGAWLTAGVAVADRGSAELVWMRVDPRAGYLVSETRPLWRLTSRSGVVVYVTSDGQLLSAARAEALR